eukprot:1552738-Rhodomonas_salina.2
MCGGLRLNGALGRGAGCRVSDVSLCLCGRLSSLPPVMVCAAIAKRRADMEGAGCQVGHEDPTMTASLVISAVSRSVGCAASR